MPFNSETNFLFLPSPDDAWGLCYGVGQRGQHEGTAEGRGGQTKD